MPGIFTSQGGNLRFPAGAIVLHTDGRAEVTQVQLASDFWPHWLAVARDGVIAAKRHNEVVRAAHANSEDRTKGDAIEAEFRAAMSSTSAQAFALDALYASVKSRIPSDTLAGIGGEDTPRHRYVTETFRRVSKFDNNQGKAAAAFVKLLYQLRDRAVHPSADFEDAVYRDDIDSGVEWRFQAYRYTNALAGFQEVSSLTLILLSNIKPRFAELAGWAKAAVKRIPSGLDYSDLRKDIPPSVSNSD